jgi:hypothetical protein
VSTLLVFVDFNYGINRLYYLLIIILNIFGNYNCVKPMTSTFAVIYSGDRPTKKRKVFHDGVLRIQHSPFQLSLIGEDGKKVLFLSKDVKNLPCSVEDMSLPMDLTLGSYSVTVEQIETAENQVPVYGDASAETGKKPSKSFKWSHGSSAFQSVSGTHNSGLYKPSEASSIPVLSDRPLKTMLELDHSLRLSMRAHQITAAQFLIERLYSNIPSTDLSAAPAEEKSSESDEDLWLLPCAKQIKHPITIPPPVTGAILADSMGLGKQIILLYIKSFMICLVSITL